MWVLKVKVISLPYIFQVLFVLCFTWPRYQVSVYRTIGPLVFKKKIHTKSPEDAYLSFFEQRNECCQIHEDSIHKEVQIVLDSC